MSANATAPPGAHQRHQTPEDINDDPDTAPSKRLEHHYTGYQKVPLGELVAESIGLKTIRAECPHFDEWMTQLEGLAPLA